MTNPKMARIVTAFFLATAAVAHLPLASAVQLSDTAGGEVLIYPLVLADEDYSTLFTVRNTSQVPIAVRSVLRDGVSGDPILTRNIFLGPMDSWVAALVWEEGPVLVTNDESCTGSFETVSVDGLRRLEVLGNRGQAWLEVFELGETSEELAGLYTSECGVPDSALPLAELAPATGRLAGDSHLIDVLSGLSFSMAPVGLLDFGGPNKIVPVAVDRPSLADALPIATIDGETSEWQDGIDAVSAVLSLASASSAFTIEGIVGARTDVVLSFPTRHYYQAQPRAPFVINTREGNEKQGQELRFLAVDRSGRNSRQPTKCSPPYPPLTAIGPVVVESQVNLHLAAEPLLNLNDREIAQFRNYDSCGEFLAPVHWAMDAGTATLDFSAFQVESLDGFVVTGLPALVVSFTQVVNGQLSIDDHSVLANYGLSNTLQETRQSAVAGE